VGITDDTLSALKFNIEQLMKEQGLNRAQLSRKAGYPNNKVTTILNGDSIPGIDFVARIAEACNRRPGDLISSPARPDLTEVSVSPLKSSNTISARALSRAIKDAHKQLIDMGDRPTMDLITAWWQQSNGRLEACDQIAPYFDVIGVPGANEKLPNVVSIGAKSLSAKTLKTNDTDALTQFLRTLSESDTEELRQCITTVNYSGTGLVTPQTRIVDLPSMKAPLEVNFVRLMLPVRDANDEPHVLNFSTLVSESTLSKSSGRLQ